MDVIEWASKELKVRAEMLRIWSERHPREAAAVREEALAKFEKRRPNYGQPEAFGVATHQPSMIENVKRAFVKARRGRGVFGLSHHQRELISKIDDR